MKTTLYSPNQVLAAAFIGGPLITLYALKQNFDVLGNLTGSQSVVRWGVAAVVLMLSVLPFLPQDFPQMVLPLAYSLVARAVAEKWQLTREQIADDERYDFIPTGRLIGQSLIGLLVFLVLSLLWLGTLDNLGIIDLPDTPPGQP